MTPFRPPSVPFHLGLQMMPPGVTTFMVVVNTSGVGMQQSNKGLRDKLIHIMSTAYPDRISNIYVGPINFLIRTIMSVVLPPVLPAPPSARRSNWTHR